MIPFGCVIHICACMYINIYAYLTTYIHIYKHTHWASPGSHCSQIISKHFLGGQIFFLPISDGLCICLAKAFHPSRVSNASSWVVSESCYASSMISVPDRYTPHNPSFFWHDSNFWLETLTFGPCKRPSCLCSFCLWLAMTSFGCHIVSSLVFQSIHHHYKQYSTLLALSPKSSYVAARVLMGTHPRTHWDTHRLKPVLTPK